MAHKYARISAEELRRLTDRSGASMAWFDKPDDEELWAFTLSVHRDSSCMERVNYEAAKAILEERFPDSENILDQRFSHFAVGWIDHLIIKVCRRVPGAGKTAPTTPEWRAVLEIKDRLEDYPCLDDDKLSELEYEEATEIVDQDLPSVELMAGNSRSRLVAEVLSALLDAGREVCANHGPTKQDMTRAMLKCNLVFRMSDESWVQYAGDADGACSYCARPRLPHPTRMQYSLDGKLLPIIAGWRSEPAEIEPKVTATTWWCPDHKDLFDHYFED